MVHAKILLPKPKPVIEVVGESELVIVPLPEINDHAPIPTVAEFAFIVVVGVEMQIVWLVPAVAIVGTCRTVSVTVETDGAHGEFEIVHANTLVPKPNPVTEVFGELGFEIVPLPDIKVHKPFPTVGALAAIIVFGLVIQSV